MSAHESTRASDVAARQVERIVEAAQDAAAGIREQAREELEAARRRGEADRERIAADAHRTGERELNGARKQAIALAEDARGEAQAVVADAQREAAQVREQTQRAVQGRVTAAEQAAGEVMAEAEALSGGMLEEQANRMLRDVQAAHRRMQADLRVGPGGSAPGERAGPVEAGPRVPAVRDSLPGARPARPPRPQEPADGAEPERSPTPARRRPNPFEDLEPPPWTGRES
jgi:hypothetical protein